MLLKNHISEKLKKYLLYVSIFFLITTFSHLLYSYFVNDAKNIPISGGTISEAIIGDFPHLNPLIYSSDYNKYIINILYRSLLKYDNDEGKITSDIANCDLKNMLYIECFIKDNVRWSDGSIVSIDDINTTYDILIKNPEINPIITSLLSDTVITTKDNSIVFANKKSDVNFLNVLMIPIVSQEVLNTISLDQIKTKFPVEGGKYSGYFSLGSIGNDETLGIKRLTLDKNKYYTDSGILFDKLLFKVFTDTSHFLKHKDAVNIFNDKSSLLGNTIPRLKAYDYILPQYFAVFLNIDRLGDKDLRTFILDKIKRENIIKVIGDTNFTSVLNPYLSSFSIDKDVNLKNIDQIIGKNGYYKPNELIDTYLTTADRKVISDEVETKEQITEVEVKEVVDLDKKLEYIVSPTTVMYNFVTEDDILLKGETRDEEVEAVYVNDYKLQGFSKGDQNFFYRLKKEGFDTILDGKNSYKIFFEKNGEKELKDEIIYYLEKDQVSIARIKDELSVFAKPQIGVSETLKIEDTASGSTEKTVLTDAALEKLSELEGLNDKYFYNTDGEEYTLELLYLNTDKNLSLVAQNIVESLAQFGIGVNANAIGVSDLNALLQSGEKNYDILLAGINLGYFDFNIFPYFHSSQIKNGYNFSNFKKLSLDIILEELKGNNLSPEKLEELKEKILTVLKDESIIKTLYTPILRQLVDKNIKDYSYPDVLKDDSLRIEYLKNAYMLEKREIDFSGKSPIGFIKYIFTTLF